MTTNKFYFFDNGVVNSLTGRASIAKSKPEFGKNLELAIYSELLAYRDYNQINKKIEYWRSTSKFEVDFLVYDNTDNIIAIEVKSKSLPTTKDFKGLLAFEEEFKLKKKIVVCQADNPFLTEDGVEVLPISVFLNRLWSGELI